MVSRFERAGRNRGLLRALGLRQCARGPFQKEPDMTESMDEFVYRSNIAILEKQFNDTGDAALRKMLSVILTEEHLKVAAKRQGRGLI
jgi:hypothetical protein